MSATVVQIAPVLPEDARQQAAALARSGLLRQLISSWVPVSSAPRALTKIPFVRRLARRRAAPVDLARLSRVPQADMVWLAARSVGASSVDAVDRKFAAVDRAALPWIQAPTRLVIGREDGCLASFRRARDQDIRRIYDLPTAHYATVHALLRRELALYPQVCTSSGDPANFGEDRCRRKDEEIGLAELVICPSNFVRDSLLRAGVPEARIRVLPFAGEPVAAVHMATVRKPVFLHVGQISLRKGVHRLLIAWKRLGAHRTATLRLVGDMRLSARFLREFEGIYEHVQFLSRNALFDTYRESQALVLNSLAEGFAMVIPEAMSCGTPVLATRNSGAEGVVNDRQEGRIFEFGDDEALMGILEWALTHPQDLAAMGERARRRMLNWTWTHYGNSFVQWIESVQGEEI